MPWLALTLYLVIGWLTVREVARRWPLKSGGFWAGFRYGYGRGLAFVLWPGVMGMAIMAEQSGATRKEGE